MRNADDLSREPAEVRQAHLDLTEPCVYRGGNLNSYRGILAQYLDTTIPKEGMTLVSHGCGNMRCSNPKHLYFGRDPWNIVGLKG